MLIRKLTVDDASAYQDLRLQALQKNPEVFGSTYEREVHFSNDDVAKRLVEIPNEQFVIGAFDADQTLRGIVSFKREISPKMRHKGTLFAMYVTQEMRNQKVGLQLLMHFVRECELIDGLEQLNLNVIASNDSAIALYEKVGFVKYGHEKNALKYLDRYYNEDLMVVDVSRVHF